MCYLYIAVRCDIPLADQIVQVGHASFEAGQRWHKNRQTCNLVLIAVANEKALLKLAMKCDRHSIGYLMFHEPDDAMGYTALCTAPLDSERRQVFRRYSLWE